MSYSARVLADSESPDGVRLLTLEVTFPRFILAEVNTHRMLSRNSASSRAIPTEKLIERVRSNPFVPETFNKRVKGMGVGDVLEQDALVKSRAAWLTAAKEACKGAESLMNLDVDKSRANRLLEPFLWHTAIISATEWDNFFGLRDHPAAQPEFQIAAKLMREAMENSTPQRLEYGWWHLPLVTEEELARLCAAREGAEVSHGGEAENVVEMLKMVSAGRCARVSFDTHENFETRDASIRRAKMLMGNGHFSPFEHVARPLFAGDDPQAGETRGADPEVSWPPNGAASFFCGNFRGWKQYRKEIPHESRFDLAIQENAAV